MRLCCTAFRAKEGTAKEGTAQDIVKHFKRKTPLTEEYSNFLKEIYNLLPDNKEKALDILFREGRQAKIKKSLIGDITNAFIIKLFPGMPGIAPKEEELLILMPTMVRVLRSPILVMEKMHPYTKQPRLTHTIEIKKEGNSYLAKRLQVEKGPPVAASERFPPNSKEFKQPSSEICRPPTATFKGVKPSEKHEEKKPIEPTNLEKEKITEIKRKICQILLQDKMHTLDLYNKVENLEEIDLSTIQQNVGQLRKLKVLSSDLEILSRKDPELKEVISKLERAIRFIEKRKVTTIEGKEFKEAVGKLNMGIAQVKYQFPACHKCFGKGQETRKLECGHYFCANCFNSTYDRVLDKEKVPFALKCPLDNCFYIAATDEISEILGKGYLDKILDNNNSRVPNRFHLYRVQRRVSASSAVCLRKMPKR